MRVAIGLKAPFAAHQTGRLRSKFLTDFLCKLPLKAAPAGDEARLLAFAAIFVRSHL